MNKIINAKIIYISKTKLVVMWNNKKFKCLSSELSDYKINPLKTFESNKSYKFLLINKNTVSYKAIRPKLIKNKKVIIPTISDSKNLNKHLISLLDNISYK